MPALTQTFWKYWYQYLSGRIGSDAVTFLNYGYWPPEGETLPLDSQDEIDRPSIQLYHHVAGVSSLEGKNVLEVSCGHGGGASFLTRYHRPASYTAIDQNPKAIDFCRRTHAPLNIDFRIGDAQALDFPENSFDAVINVEASHCYPDQAAFYASVKHVLKTGGQLLHADFRPRDELLQWEKDIADNFQVASKTDITPHVIRALQRTTERFRALAHRLSPKILHRAMETFAGIEGSAIYNSFVNGERTYLSFQLVKPA
ncbi:MAG: class I SAM-dependent methyltransferase [Anaerolineales bacterium]|nr:class I SAM-dependent methyltransferase [Anaerolineales bacterium]